MSIQVEDDFDIKNEDLKKEVEVNNPLKEFIINYVGTKLSPEDEMVSLEMVVQVLADEFPEFMLAVAEENWIRGYYQALHDVEQGEKILKENEEVSNEEEE